MKKSDFYFDLPERLIAQHPLEQRDASRMMVLDRKAGSVTHRHFHDMLEYVKPGDCVVFNNSRVIPARLMGHAVGHVTPIEVLLLTDKGDGLWECLTRPGRKTRAGVELTFGDGLLTATVEAGQPDGNRLIRFHYEGIFLASDEMIDNEPDVLAGFLTACSKGFEDFKNSTDEVLQVLLDNQDEANFALDPDVEKKSCETLLPLMETADAKFLSQTEACWQENIDWMYDEGLISAKPEVSDVMATIAY